MGTCICPQNSIAPWLLLHSPGGAPCQSLSMASPHASKKARRTFTAAEACQQILDGESSDEDLEIRLTDEEVESGQSDVDTDIVLGMKITSLIIAHC